MNERRFKGRLSNAWCVLQYLFPARYRDKSHGPTQIGDFLWPRRRGAAVAVFPPTTLSQGALGERPVSKWGSILDRMVDTWYVQFEESIFWLPCSQSHQIPRNHKNQLKINILTRHQSPQKHVPLDALNMCISRFGLSGNYCTYAPSAADFFGCLLVFVQSFPESPKQTMHTLSISNACFTRSDYVSKTFFNGFQLIGQVGCRVTRQSNWTLVELDVGKWMQHPILGIRTFPLRLP